MLRCSFLWFLVQEDFSLDGEPSQTASACLSPAHGDQRWRCRRSVCQLSAARGPIPSHRAQTAPAGQGAEVTRTAATAGFQNDSFFQEKRAHTKKFSQYPTNHRIPLRDWKMTTEEGRGYVSVTGCQSDLFRRRTVSFRPTPLSWIIKGKKTCKVLEVDLTESWQPPTPDLKRDDFTDDDRSCGGRTPARCVHPGGRTGMNEGRAPCVDTPAAKLHWRGGFGAFLVL